MEKENVNKRGNEIGKTIIIDSDKKSFGINFRTANDK